jgi:hypothetical protein
MLILVDFVNFLAESKPWDGAAFKSAEIILAFVGPANDAIWDEQDAVDEWGLRATALNILLRITDSAAFSDTVWSLVSAAIEVLSQPFGVALNQFVAGLQQNPTSFSIESFADVSEKHSERTDEQQAWMQLQTRLNALRLIIKAVGSLYDTDIAQIEEDADEEESNDNDDEQMVDEDVMDENADDVQEDWTDMDQTATGNVSESQPSQHKLIQLVQQHRLIDCLLQWCESLNGCLLPLAYPNTNGLPPFVVPATPSPLGHILQPLSESLFELQLQSWESLHRIFSRINAEWIQAWCGAQPQAEMQQLFMRIGTHAMAQAQSSSETWVTQIDDSIRAEIAQETHLRQAFVLRASLETCWALGRGAVDTTGLIKTDWTIAFVQFLETVYRQCGVAGASPDLDFELVSIRMIIMGLLSVVVQHKNISADEAHHLGGLLLTIVAPSTHSVAHGESSPMVRAEAINAFLDLFGPDDHNSTFAQRMYLPRIKACIPEIKKMVKSVDPRLPSPRINLRELRDRAQEMLANFARFIRYKETSQ